MKRKSTQPIKIFTLDTETYEGLKGGLKKIAIYDGNKELNVIYGNSFTEIEPYLIESYKDGFDTHVYIHNAEFDLRKIPQIFYNHNVIWEKSMVISGKIAKLSCKYYTIHDSFKILPSSLMALSKSFDVECGKLDLLTAVNERYPNQYNTKDVVDFLDRCPINDSLFLEYLGYDVISLYQVIEKAREEFGLSVEEWVKILSTASLSRYIFKNGFKGKKFISKGSKKTDFEIMCSMDWTFCDEDSEQLQPLEIEEIIRESYCGGRCEVFTPILNHCGFHYDVNSLYPSQFYQEYPVGQYEFFDDADIIKINWEKWTKNHRGLGFITAEIYIPKQNIPPLPVKMGKLTFPTGYVRGTWTYIELEYAVKNCGVIIEKFHEMIHFSKTFPIFKNFVNVFYPMKEHAAKIGDSAGKMVAKLCMNTGYGYTGMRRDDKSSLISIYDMNKPEFKGKIKNINEDFGYCEVDTEVKAKYIQVQIASYVTSYARLVLLDALRHADNEGNVYYCDTDSIVTDHPLPDNIVDHTKLGYWDLEGEIKQAIFLRPKVYAEILQDGSINKKFKGISRDTVKEWDFQKYEWLCHELAIQEKSEIVLEEDKLVLPSIMVMLKNDRDLSETDYRTKSINLLNKEKRQIDYVKNYTQPWYMFSYQYFDDFSFLNIKENVEIDLEKSY